MPPIAQLRAVDPILTDLSLGYSQPGQVFVAGAILPEKPVTLETGTFPVWGKERFRQVKDLRGAGDLYARTTSAVGVDTFVCNEYGQERPIDDRERTQAIPVTDADVTDEITESHLLNYERRVVAKVTDVAVITQNIQPAAADKWGGANNPNPFVTIKTGKTTILTATGRMPNTIVMGRPVWDWLSEYTGFIEKIKYTQFGVTSLDLAARAFEVDRVLVADAIGDTAKEGHAATLAQIWGKDLLLAYVSPTTNVRTMSLGWTFTSRARAIQNYRSEDRNSDVIRVSSVQAEKIAAAACAYLCKGIVA